MRRHIRPQECLRKEVARAVAGVLGYKKGGAAGAGRKSLVYIRGRNGCSAREAALGRAERSWSWKGGSPAGKCRPQVPTLAFRWLAGSGRKRVTPWGAPLGARHRQGEVLVSEMLKAIYVNVPKTGSSSVKRALASQRTEMWHNLDGATKDTYVVFAFARDPMARFLSAYNEVDPTALLTVSAAHVAARPSRAASETLDVLAALP